jgi:hypothetical protein
MSIDFDAYHLCPHCREPMQVCVPIWITPGEQQIDTGNIDYESGMPDDAGNWYCPECSSHHFPLPDAVDPSDYEEPEKEEQ